MSSCASDLFQAESLFYEKQYEEAISELNKYLFLHVTDVKALHLRARSHEELGDMKSAIEDYEKILSIDPNYAQAMAGIGKIYFNEEKYKEAELILLRAAKTDPEDYEINFLTGRVLLQNQDYKLANSFFEHAKLINTEDPELYFYQGMARAYIGDAYGCAGSFNMYVGKQPNNMVAVYNRGFAYMHLGYLEWALEDFETVLKKNPTHREALAKKGICMAKLGDNDGCNYIQRAASMGSDYAQSNLDICS
ncbi:tetratricopeptide repeat protein [Algoriphagus vanfongensis]|uniref:tetratricopeptide repeat protein n=1 Tax=Algoriphagus vanfongensis TaxID=426371 RepID=UPI001FE219D6|nr:tetratricopeptide repeat protein [Algoriphagus vanfongensis]